MDFQRNLYCEITCARACEPAVNVITLPFTPIQATNFLSVVLLGWTIRHNKRNVNSAKYIHTAEQRYTEPLDSQSSYKLARHSCYHLIFVVAATETWFQCMFYSESILSMFYSLRSTLLNVVTFLVGRSIWMAWMEAQRISAMLFPKMNEHSRSDKWHTRLLMDFHWLRKRRSWVCSKAHPKITICSMFILVDENRNLNRLFILQTINNWKPALVITD